MTCVTPRIKFAFCYLTSLQGKTPESKLSGVFPRYNHPDDFTAQPSGNSGAKIAYRVIKRRPGVVRGLSVLAGKHLCT